jgi:hypothetical protein
MLHNAAWWLNSQTTYFHHTASIPHCAFAPGLWVVVVVHDTVDGLLEHAHHSGNRFLDVKICAIVTVLSIPTTLEVFSTV